MNTIDKILITLASFIFGFTITMIVIFCIYQVTPDTLIECVYSLAGSEAIITAVIWYAKKKIGGQKNGKTKE